MKYFKLYLKYFLNFLLIIIFRHISVLLALRLLCINIMHNNHKANTTEKQY